MRAGGKACRRSEHGFLLLVDDGSGNLTRSNELLCGVMPPTLWRFNPTSRQQRFVAACVLVPIAVAMVVLLGKLCCRRKYQPKPKQQRQQRRRRSRPSDLRQARRDSSGSDEETEAAQAETLAAAAGTAAAASDVDAEPNEDEGLMDMDTGVDVDENTIYTRADEERMEMQHRRQLRRRQAAARLRAI